MLVQDVKKVLLYEKLVQTLMINNPQCPLCRKSEWYKVGEHVYCKKDTSLYGVYERARLRVLFENWCPDSEFVKLVFIVCEVCGFVSYSPRPDSNDVKTKYHELSRHGHNYGIEEQIDILSRRRQRMYNAIKQLLPAVKGKILDYGGGDGRLMSPLKKMGHHCYILDYNDKLQKYVEKLGDTIEDIDDKHFFDLIICNHVIEHVADPVDLIKSLSRHLCPGGHLFVEVPMEIWRKAPIHSEPVTHINFFVKGSLKRCVEEAGLVCTAARIAPYLHPSGRIMPAVQAVGVLNESESVNPSSSGRREVEACLHPKMIDRLSRAVVLREKLPEMVGYKLGLKRFMVN